MSDVGVPKFCNKCGKELEYRFIQGFDTYTGKPYKRQEFLECPVAIKSAQESKYKSWTHSRYQFMGDLWLPLDFI